MGGTETEVQGGMAPEPCIPKDAGSGGDMAMDMKQSVPSSRGGDMAMAMKQSALPA